MSVCFVETLVTYRAWCSEHGSVGPLRESEGAAYKDAERHVDCGCDG